MSRPNLTRPYLMLYRKRLIFAAVWTILVILIAFPLIRLNLCGCPPDSDSATTQLLILLCSNTFLCISLAILLGLGISHRNAGAPNLTRFLFTRPISRNKIFAAPIVLATAVVAVLPILGWLTVFAIFRLAHPATLHHLYSLASLAPNVAQLGPHPAVFQLLTALQVPRRYLAALSVAFCYYAPFGSMRWLMLSDNTLIKRLSLTPLLLLLASLTLLPISAIGSAFASAIFLLPLNHNALTYLPSNLGIALHLAFAIPWLTAAHHILRRAEI